MICGWKLFPATTTRRWTNTSCARFPATRLARILKMVDRYAAMISPRLSRAGRSATESARALMANASAKSDEVGHAMVRVVGLYPPGTFVRLDNDDLAVVVRRSSTANQPYIAVLGNAAGELLATPQLHNTAKSTPHIRTALGASSVRARLNHFHILRLSAVTARSCRRPRVPFWRPV